VSVNSAGPGNGRGAGNRACSSHARLMANDCTGWNRDISQAFIGLDYPGCQKPRPIMSYRETAHEI
jgi:hypothetical protein